MSQVRAKFVCGLIEDQPSYNQKSVHFSPVISGSEENKSFSKYTPAGSISLTISNDTPASNFFMSGQEYFIDFTKAE